MNVLDLFSGIGGFSLGLERAGMRTVAFCEIDPHARAVLAKHWPDVPCFNDIRELTAGRITERIDVVCGGFPCQPFSSAARGRNTRDGYLWPEMLRVITELRPAWVVGENVADLDRMALETVCADLEASGYEVQTLEIPACAVDADHIRRRLWILGYAYSESESSLRVHAEVAGLSRSNDDTGSVRATNGLPGRLDRMRLLGNAIVPAIAEIIGRAIVSAHA